MTRKAKAHAQHIFVETIINCSPHKLGTRHLAIYMFLHTPSSTAGNCELLEPRKPKNSPAAKR